MTVPLFGAHQEETTSDDFLTPSWVFDALSLEFNLDVAASPFGGFVPAARQFTKADDGLAQEWQGRVWMNPPYSEARLWVPRFISHGHGVALLPMARSNWLNDLWNVADGMALLPKVGSFVFVGGTVSYGCMLFAFGVECVEAIGRLGRVR